MLVKEDSKYIQDFLGANFLAAYQEAPETAQKLILKANHQEI